MERKVVCMWCITVRKEFQCIIDRINREPAQPMTAGGDGKAAAPATAARSRCRVSLRRGAGGDSCWRAHEFEVWTCAGDQLLCRAAVLRMRDSLLLWVGGAGGALGEGALATAGAGGATASCTALLPGEGAAGALARRLAAALHKPVFVFCGASFDRFTLPLVEGGLVAEIKSRPECF